MQRSRTTLLCLNQGTPISCKMSPVCAPHTTTTQQGLNASLEGGFQNKKILTLFLIPASFFPLYDWAKESLSLWSVECGPNVPNVITYNGGPAGLPIRKGGEQRKAPAARGMRNKITFLYSKSTQN